jgi:hypothetical protein
MQSFTFGTTPEHVIREAFDRAHPDGFTVVWRGIDAVTLEAAGCPGDGAWTADELVATLGALAATFDGAHDERARELMGRYSALEIIENAASLRTSILEVLGIEEV